MTDNLDKDGTPVEQDNSQADQESGEAHPNDSDAVTKRHQEQMEGSRQEVERMRSLLIDSGVQNAEQNAKSLLELHEKDPIAANEVAKRFGYKSYGDAKEAVLDLGRDSMEQNQKQPSLKDDFEKMYQEKRSQEMHTESLKKALKKAENIISKLSDEKRDQAQSYFDKITKGKTLTEADAKEYAEMATLYVSRDEIREGRGQEARALLGTSGASKPSSKAPDNKKDGMSDFVIRGGRIISLNSNK